MTYLIRGALIVLAFVVAMLAAASARGDCRAVNRNARALVANSRDVRAVLFAEFALPSYQVGYSGGTDDKTEKRIDKLEQQQAQIIKLLEKLAGGAPAAAPATKQEERDPHLPVFVARCASCHESGVSKAKGGGLTLLRSAGSEMQAAPLSAEQRLAVVREVYEGTMPKGKTACTDEETAAIVKGMTRK